ncbi:unnamed protein product [Anisakis simplex]|uniref:Epididymal secretory protein E1 n=1 Tax=Anisakis simplex TaxID=6269 RepID=A0A0M3JNN3_ANISI|nr:unnamed protein product [Anisakis simplex]
MDELRGMNFIKMVQKILLPMDLFLQWLQVLGLVSSSQTCVCGGEMVTENKGTLTGKRWACRHNWCRKKRGFLVGSFFENTSLTPQEVFQLSYYWCRNTHTISEIQFDMRREDGSTLRTRTTVDWNNFFRDIRVEYFIQNPVCRESYDSR